MSSQILMLSVVASAKDTETHNYGSEAPFTLFLAPENPIPFNVQCDKHKMMCAIDMLSRGEGKVFFWCTHGEGLKRCGFSLEFSQPREVR